MPSPYFILFELIIYLQFALCLRHAWTHRPANVLRLFFGAAFGVMLELATIRQLNAYTYGRFMLMVLDVPLCIGVAWGAIIYSVMEFSDSSDLPVWARPVLDGLLAINIDLALDAVAIRLGFWDWGQGFSFQYFGVPFANFWAWFWVVTSFSMGYRLLSPRKDWVGAYLSAPLALILGLVGVLGTNSLISYVIPFIYHGVTVTLVLGGFLYFMFLMKPRFHLRPEPTLVFWVPFLSHAYLLVAGLVSGVILDPPFLLLVSLVMLGIAFILHRATIQEIFARKSAQ
jgi:hypothetical protein